MKYITRYEVTNPLGAGGSLVKTFKTLEEARSFIFGKDLNIYKSIFKLSNDNKKRFRVSSSRVI